MPQLHPVVVTAIGIIQKEVGVEESPRGSNLGKRVEEFQSADDLKGGGYAWCACLLIWGLREAWRRLKMPNPVPFPLSPSCDAWLAWAREKGILFDEPQPGDFGLVMKSKNDATHIFLVTKVWKDNLKTRLATVEGNSNDDGSREGYGVVAHERTDSSRLKYIRLTDLLQRVAAPLPFGPHATPAKPVAATAPKSGTILKGDGTWPFTAQVDGADIVLRDQKATWFGGDNDAMDAGLTASGVVTKGNPLLLGCALPLRNVSSATKGSPIPRLPWKTVVRVFCRETGRQIDVPLIDVGPGKRTGNAIDLTQEAFRALGGALSKGVLNVDFRILGGARYVKDATHNGT